jgi:hypothetical protein
MPSSDKLLVTLEDGVKRLGFKAVGVVVRLDL